MASQVAKRRASSDGKHWQSWCGSGFGYPVRRHWHGYDRTRFQLYGPWCVYRVLLPRSTLLRVSWHWMPSWVCIQAGSQHTYPVFPTLFLMISRVCGPLSHTSFPFFTGVPQKPVPSFDNAFWRTSRVHHRGRRSGKASKSAQVG